MNPQLRIRRAQRGFTLLELMIAMTIGIFLLGALLTIVQTNRRVFGEQNLLSQMQDNQRMALTMMGDVIQSAGYFPEPWKNSMTTILNATGPFAVGQSINGYASGTPAGDVLQVRYVTNGGDGILNCSGGSNTNAVETYQMFTNQFQVLGGQLVCIMNGTQYNLVGNLTASGSKLDITNMTVLYGVKTSTTSAGNNVDTYMTAAQVGGLWANVISVQVTLTFTNPLYAVGNGELQTFTVQRLVGVMNQTGPTQ
jgi:type IV pilus assembly protein PilW